MKTCPNCHKSWGDYKLTCDCGYELPVRWTGVGGDSLAGCVVNSVAGILLGGACFALVGRSLVDYMLVDNADGLCTALFVMLIMCFVLFMLRFVADRLKTISTIMLIAVMTFVLTPIVLFALFLMSGGFGD